MPPNQKRRIKTIFDHFRDKPARAKIDTQFSMHYSVVRAMDEYRKERKAIVASILAHASALEKESEQLLREIEAELSRLS